MVSFKPEVIRHLRQKHKTPADQTGKRHPFYSHAGNQKIDEYHAKGDLDERGIKRDRHITHPPEKSLNPVGKGRHQIKKRHQAD